MIAAAATSLCFAALFYNNGIIDREKLYTSSRVYEDIKLLAEKYPDLIKLGSIGSSVKGKNIPLIILGKGGKKACVIAGLHAREHITVSFTLLCVEEYCRAYSSDSGLYGKYNMRELLNEYTLYIAPDCNPDGMDICNSGEKPKTKTAGGFDREHYKNNANNVNLNANFPFYWSDISDKSRQKGPRAASEAETRNIMKLCRENSFEWLLDMHMAGNCIFWRDAANGEVEGDKRLATALEAECGYYLCPVTGDVNDYGGGLENWFRGEMKRPAVCVELVLKSGATAGMSISDYNKNFDKALNWEKTRFTLAAAMAAH